MSPHPSMINEPGSPLAETLPIGNRADASADVCLFIEGAYPYVTGGVSQWVHDLVTKHKRLKFHVVCLVADDRVATLHYQPPANVLSLRNLVLQQRSTHCPSDQRALVLMKKLETPMKSLLLGGGREDLRQLMQVLSQHRDVATLPQLLNSQAAYAMVQRMYESSVPRSSFLHYFWSWRSLMGGLYAVLLSRLPNARTYHALSTGYAGMAMARAVIATGRPGLLTEHGIYTNERRIEIAMADWLREAVPPSLSIDQRPTDLRDVWMNAFAGFSRATYESANRIITLFEGNQTLQERDGAVRRRMTVVPNGVNVRRLRAIERTTDPKRPVVALIGRVVPIKDIKTFIRAAAILRTLVPNVRVLMIGPRDEDPEYDQACADMVSYLGLDGTFEFTGPMDTEEALINIDVLVLTSLSEAQPLVMLEAGAAGIPCVATDVGACREVVHGRAGEFPPLPAGGLVTPLANPNATAQAIAQLLNDHRLRAQCGAAIRERVRRYYNLKMVNRSYREIYAEHVASFTAVSEGQALRKTLIVA